MFPPKPFDCPGVLVAFRFFFKHTSADILQYHAGTRFATKGDVRHVHGSVVDPGEALVEMNAR